MTSMEEFEQLCDASERYKVITVLQEIKSEIKRHCCITVGSENAPAMTLYDIFKIIDEHIDDYSLRGKNDVCLDK